MIASGLTALLLLLVTVYALDDNPNAWANRPAKP